MKILIIGFGNLGFRHAQGVAKFLSKNTGKLEIYDKIPASYDHRIDEFESLHTSFLYSFPVNQSYDLVIVSCDSKSRLTVAEKFFKNNSARVVILEKFLFPKLNQYREFESILSKQTAKVYVNSPFRYFEFYQIIKQIMDSERVKIEKIEVIGSENLGLGCNSIHYIYALKWLANEHLEAIDTRKVHSIFNSKRAGYVEFLGTVDYLFSNCCLSLTSESSINVNEVIVSFYRNKKLVFDENTGFIKSQNIKHKFEGRLHYRFQSQLSNEYCAQVLRGDELCLPSYEKINVEHEMVLKALQKVGSKLSGKAHDDIFIT